MSKKYVKMNPLIRVFDAIRDEKLDVIFDGYKWEEVTEAQWKRLKESQTKQGDVLIPTFIEKDEGMGEVVNLLNETIVEDSNDDEWMEIEETDEVQEEE
jgi:hypothetical protein